MAGKTFNQRKKAKKLKEIRKVGIWAIGLVLLTSAVGIGMGFFSSAFGIEDKVSAVELCNFDLPGVEKFEDIRTVTAGNGRHIFLAESLDSKTGERNGMYAFEEGQPGDPCMGIKPVSLKLGDSSFYDISSAQVYMYEWDLLNTVYIPDVYTENTEDGYIVLFMREKTNSYEKEMVALTLEYKTGSLSFKNMMTVFPNDPNFTSIVDLHYSFETSSLYVFGVADSEGFRSRGIRTAGIGHEDLLQGRATFSYCSTDDANTCNWSQNPADADIIIDAMKGDLDVLGVEDDLSLMIQNTDGKLTVYDLAAAGTFWNPGLRLLSCDGYEDCGKIVTYDYQASYFENPAENLEIMTFYFLQSDGSQIRFYEGKVDDYTIKDETVAAMFAPKVAFAKIAQSDTAPVRKATSRKATVVKKKRSKPPKNNRVKSKVQRVIREKSVVKTVAKPAAVAKADDDKVIKAVKEEKTKKVIYVATKPAKKKKSKTKALVDKLLKKEEVLAPAVEVVRVPSPTKDDLVFSVKEKQEIRGLPTTAPKGSTKSTAITETPKNGLTLAEKRLIAKLDCAADEVADDIGACVPDAPDNPGMVAYNSYKIAAPAQQGAQCDANTQVYDATIPGCVSFETNQIVALATTCREGLSPIKIDGTVYCYSIHESASCKHIFFNGSGSRFCAEEATVSEDVSLIGSGSSEPNATLSTCDYGANASDSINSNFTCDDKYLTCPSGVTIVKQPSGTSVPAYAAFAHCISNGTVVAACEPGSRVVGGKCVVPGYYDPDFDDVSDFEGDPLGAAYSLTDPNWAINKYYAQYLEARYSHCSPSWTSCVGTGDHLQHSISSKCLKTTGSNLSVVACCAAGWHADGNVCIKNSTGNPKVDCTVGVHAYNSCNNNKCESGLTCELKPGEWITNRHPGVVNDKNVCVSSSESAGFDHVRYCWDSSLNEE